MADPYLRVAIEHSIEILSTTNHEVDLAGLVDWAQRTGREIPADGGPWPGDLLREYVEDDMNSGDPVPWLPDFEMPEGYEYYATNVHTVTAAQLVGDPA